MRTTVSTAATTLWLAALGLVTTPYLIHRLGVSAYGIFALITIVSAYLSNLEFGFGHASIRFLSQARARGDAVAERAILGTSFAVFLPGGLTACVIALLGSSFIARTFADVPAELEGQALDALRLGALTLFLSFLTSLSSATLRAFGRFEIVIRSRLVFGTLASVAALVAVTITPDVRAVILGQLIVAALLFVVLFVGVVRASGGWIRPWIDVPTLRAMTSFGLFILASGLAYQVMLQGPVTVLAGTASITQVGIFAVPSLVFLHLATLVTAPSLSFLPFASATADDVSHRHLGAVFTAHLRLMTLVMGPIASYLIFFSEPLLSIWINPDFARDAADPMRLLGVAALMVALSGAPADVARGIGRPAWVLAYTAGAAAVGLGTALLVVESHGAAGAAFSLCLGLTISTIPFLLLVARKLLDLPLRHFLDALRLPLVAVTCVGACYAAAFVIAPTFLGAITGGAIATSLYAAFVARVVLDDRERQAMRRSTAP